MSAPPIKAAFALKAVQAALDTMDGYGAIRPGVFAYDGLVVIRNSLKEQLAKHSPLPRDERRLSVT